jgi:predicted acetyltransferase
MASGEGCRPAEDDDKPAIQSVYQEFARTHNASTARPEEWWSEREPSDESLYLVHVGGDGCLDGYARYKTHWRHDEDGLLVDTLELATKSERVEAELASGLAGLPDVSRVRLLLPRDTSIPHFLPKRLHIQVAQRLQFRVLDVGKAVSALQARPDLKGSIRFEIWDWVLSPDRPVPSVVNVEGGRIELDRSHKKAPVLRTTVQVFSQVFSGLLRPSKAAAWGFLEVEEHATLKLADSLFSGRTPFRSAVEPG